MIALPGKGLSRRRFVQGLAGLGIAGAFSPPLFAGLRSLSSAPYQHRMTLDIGYREVNFTGQKRMATVVNGSLPAPTLRWREGERVHLTVRNHLAHDSSIHWHGLILPNGMDGVPGLTFDGIKPGESFEYSFDLVQSGTYWYHSHSGFQEQTGVYGAIVIDPAQPDPVEYDRDYVVMLSDWSDDAPEQLYARLKKQSHYYNFRERTVADWWDDVRKNGWRQTAQDRAMWNHMRMSDTDIADVSAYTYTYLMNGMPPASPWTALFKRGEKVRLRFINAAAMTLFDVRIPGLRMRVVASDGQNIEPVTVDEFRIGVAETYDVVVEPCDDTAYNIFAQSIDRGGFCAGHLTPNAELLVEPPAMDEAPTLTHADMGMAHGSHAAHAGHGMHEKATAAMNDDKHHSHHHMHHDKGAAPLGKAGMGSQAAIIHADTEFGPQVDMRADAPRNGLSDPGIGLRDHMRRHGRRVLRYADLFNLTNTIDQREPEREVALHLTGNMARYMWSFDGVPFADAEPLALRFGERLRITLINDTMMTHPIHLHGLWSELETGEPQRIPRKHTVLVQPGSKVSYLVTADAYGRWAYHCHLLYHMPGMMREVRVCDA